MLKGICVGLREHGVMEPRKRLHEGDVDRHCENNQSGLSERPGIIRCSVTMQIAIGEEEDIVGVQSSTSNVALGHLLSVGGQKETRRWKSLAIEHVGEMNQRSAGGHRSWRRVRGRDMMTWNQRGLLFCKNTTRWVKA